MSVQPPFLTGNEETSSGGLKRPQSEPVMYADVKRPALNTHAYAEYRATPYSYSTPNVYQTISTINFATGFSPASCAYSMAAMTIPPSEQLFFPHGSSGGNIREEVYGNPLTHGGFSRQKYSRTRRLPARYRDDGYVCMLGDGSRGNEVYARLN
ncbi:unnamed protein product [Cylicostephanus goldi]|uniref:Uncharacterized protein n=1 Tax=Cylicostephanus goldi TaxID=71465 RepID=A0A3P6UWP5_CYLGO|nr:unnamed protein product [Cylicostephanus goldi]